MIERPTHYNSPEGDLFDEWSERYPIQVLREVMRCTAERYIRRYPEKNGTEDLRKGIYTLQRLLEYEEGYHGSIEISD